MNEHLRRALSASYRTEGSIDWQPPDKASESAPALWAFLTETRGVDEGEIRETATLLVFRDGDSLKALITDRETGRKLFVTCGGLGTLFQACEHALTADHPDWRMDKGQGKRPGKGK